MVRHLRRALQLVPIKGATIHRALERAEEHDREELSIAEALQPDVEEQPSIAFIRRVFRLKAEGQRRSNKVDDDKGQEVEHQLVKAGRAGRLRVIVAID